MSEPCRDTDLQNFPLFWREYTQKNWFKWERTGTLSTGFKIDVYNLYYLAFKLTLLQGFIRYLLVRIFDAHFTRTLL
ncbi:MAG TPA: hypothetical protein DD622_05305 [Opitutae bacterium]|nr:hypothetical protein [Coraliomargarita sp.]HBO57839.1 hypothetical protein [Opitutae bacterium]